MYVDPLNKSNLPPTLTDLPIPTPPDITNAPEDADIVLLSELKVAVPEEAPKEMVCAAPKAFIVVALVLKTANVAVPVVTLVVKSGEVANVSAPEPVLSEIAEEIADEVVDAETVPDEIVRTPEELLRFCPVPPYCVAITVPFQAPLVIAPLAILTPDMLEPVPPTYKLPPIPTPPETVKAPLLKLVEAVVCVILTTAVVVLFLKDEEPLILAPVAA